MQNTLLQTLQNKIHTLETTSRQSDTEAIVSSGCEAINSILPSGGFPRGSLVEWFPRINRHHDQTPNPKFNKQDSSLENHRESPRHQFNSVEEGSGAMYLALATAKEACRNGGAFVILDQHRTFYPPAALAWGFRSKQIIILQPNSEKDLYWSLHQALSCPAVGAVWGSLGRLDEYTFRRLQLAAETSGCLGLLERPQSARGEPSWSEIQLSISPFPRTRSLSQQVKNDHHQTKQNPNGSSLGMNLHLSNRSTNQTTQSTKSLRKHPKNFSANRFLKIQLIRSRHGHSGATAYVEVDSFTGQIRHTSQPQTRVHTRPSYTYPTPGVNEPSTPGPSEISKVYLKRIRNRPVATQSIHEPAINEKTHSLPLATQLVNSKNCCRTTGS